ncbi:MAG: PDZ domain-containing protein [Candidatus Omnitrophica bacterium]|nr:PDZ domain-containing protein [Candidatus Omnitrophota bacterium]
MAKKYKKINRQKVINESLLFIIVSIAILLIFFIDRLSFGARSTDPRLWLGIETIQLTPELSKQYDIQSPSGILISRIFLSSPAQAAGLKEGDIIKRWNGVSITNQDQFQNLIQTSGINEKITFSVERQGSQILVYGKVGIRPGGI